MRVGFIAGAFDVIHPGYVSMFWEARSNCDHLIVALHRDPTIERPEKMKLVLDYWDRFNTLNAIKYIDQIIPYDTEADLVVILERVKPHVRFLGDDYLGKQVTGSHLNIPIQYLDRSHGWSTTLFKQKIKQSIDE